MESTKDKPEDVPPSPSRRVVDKIIDHGVLEQTTKLPRLYLVEWKKGPNTIVPEWQEHRSLKAKCPRLLDRYLQDNQLGKYFVKRPEMKKRLCTELAVRKAVTPPARKATKRSTTKPGPARRRKLSPQTHYCRLHSRSPSRSVSPCAKPEPEPGQVRYTGRLQLTPGPKFRSIPDPYDSKADLWVRQT